MSRGPRCERAPQGGLTAAALSALRAPILWGHWECARIGVEVLGSSWGETMKFANFARFTAIAVLGLGCLAVPIRPAAAEDANKAQVDALRKSLEKYQDYKVAVRDLYLSTVACVHYA